MCVSLFCAVAGTLHRVTHALCTGNFVFEIRASPSVLYDYDNVVNIQF